MIYDCALSFNWVNIDAIPPFFTKVANVTHNSGRWDTRYGSTEEYGYGEEPNAFVKESVQAGLVPKEGCVICLGGGGGSVILMPLLLLDFQIDVNCGDHFGIVKQKKV